MKGFKQKICMVGHVTRCRLSQKPFCQLLLLSTVGTGLERDTTPEVERLHGIIRKQKWDLIPHWM